MKKIAQKFSAATIAKRISELGTEIRNDAPDGEIFLIGILKGSAVFLSDLIRAIDGNVGYAFIDVIRDVSDTQTAEAMEIDFLSHFDMGGRNLYILKDVVSTGVIESYLLTQLRQRNPSDIKLVALLDHTDLRKMDLKVDYTAFEVGSGTFVGYGLEADGRYGNLPYIGKV